jgi:hypothetical protein
MSKPWHLLVFMSADNSLYSNALVSLRQLTEGSKKLDNVKITVQFEGPTADDAARYSCENGTRKMIFPAPKGDRAKPAERLSDFLSNAQVKPNEQIFLILWGHGSGIDYVYLYSDPSLPGSASHNAAATSQSAQLQQAALSIPVDVINPNTQNANRYVKNIQLGTILGMYTTSKAKLTKMALSTSEAKMGLSTSGEELLKKTLLRKKLLKNTVNRKIDILGFDSCLMGMAEICHEVSGSVDFVVASDEEIPKQSFPYDKILEALRKKPDMDSSVFSGKIVDAFMKRYEKASAQTRISLSAYRLGESDNLIEKIKAFVNAVFSDIDTVRSRILLARNFSRTPEVPDYIDLGIFCDEIMLSFIDPSKPIDKIIHDCAKEIRELLNENQYILRHRELSPKDDSESAPEGIAPASESAPEGIAPGRGLAVYFPQAMPPITSKSIQDVVDNQTVQHLSQYEPPDKGMKHTGSDPKKTLLVFRTGPPDPNKIPTSDQTRDLDVELVQRQLIGSEVLWCDYTKLIFNQVTSWAEMVEELITGRSDETTECAQS